MKPNSELALIIHHTREEARLSRQSSQEALHRASELMARARELCARHGKLQAEEAKARLQKEPRTWRRIHALRVEVLEQLKQSLSDLEGVRMISEQEPQLRDLKEDLRKTIEGAEGGGGGAEMDKRFDIID